VPVFLTTVEVQTDLMRQNEQNVSPIIKTKQGDEITENKALTLNENENKVVSEVTRKVGSKWCIYSKKKTKGKRKNLGCFSSKKAVKKREKQVNYFKHVK